MAGRKSAKEEFVTVEEVRRFEASVAQLQALSDQFAAQTAKKPDSPINKFKLGIVNEKLVQANRLLQGDYRPLDGFTEFPESDLPTNSDVSLVLSAYLSSFERWRSARVYQQDGSYSWYWRIKDGTSIEGRRPTSYQPEE